MDENQKFIGSLLGPAFLASVDRSGTRVEKDQCVYIVDGYQVPSGYRAYLLDFRFSEALAMNLHSYCPTSSVLYGISCEGINDFDVVEVNEKGQLRIVYSDAEEDNVLFISNKCNSNCIMCPDSNANRQLDLGRDKDYLFRLVELIPSDARHLTITGGEPTLLTWDFIRLLAKCKEKFTNTDFLMLSNGRTLCIKEYRDAFLEAVPHSFRLGIPLYAASAKEHDSITRAEGSFEQTLAALKVLQHRIDIEIRIVVMKNNYRKIPEIAEFICKEIPRVRHVCMMGIELMGNAAIARDDLWVDFVDTAPYLERAATTLFSAGIDAMIYNYPLCSLPRHLWNIAEKSITEYKIRYKEECANCEIKDLCGGFFFSTMHFEDITVRPIVGALKSDEK